MTLAAFYTLALGALVAVDPLERYRSWRRRCEEIPGLSEYARKRDALRQAVKR